MEKDKIEINDKELENVIGGNDYGLPASTLGPSSYGSQEISVISYKTEDTEWNTTRPTDVGDYNAEYNVNGGENYGAPTSFVNKK